MITRKKFLQYSGCITAGTLISPSLWANFSPITGHEWGVQLYTFRDQMLDNPMGTLERIAALGIKKIETARSEKGHYYGLTPAEMKAQCSAPGMQLVSGHVHLDQDWDQTIALAVESGQEYLICSSMPTEGQTVANYEKVAKAFNTAGAACKSAGIKFGYHNHEYEFETHKGKVLYDILLENTDPDLVHWELDLGWVLVAGKDPLDYFKRYEKRFPLWHLKDMDMKRKESTEFGKGGLDIPLMLANAEVSGLKHIFIEQEEYESGPFKSMMHNMDYLKDLNN